VQLTIQEIIELTGAVLTQGDLNHTVSGVASLDEAGGSEISFLGNEKYFQDFLITKAGVVIVPGHLPQKPECESIVLLEVENPSYAFAAVVKVLAMKQRTIEYGVHPTAFIADDVVINRDKVSIKAGVVIEAGCSIGDGTEIGSGVVICEGSRVGENCLFYPNVTVREHSQIGARVILQPGCVIGSDGYGYELINGKHTKVDQVGIVVLEDDVEIGANTTIDRARFGKTIIGEGTKVDNLVQIAHNVQTGKHCLIVSQSGLAGSSKLGNYVTVAAQAGVVGHIKIGDQAILAGRAGATKSLEGGVIYSGFPARPMREENRKQGSLSKLPQLIKDVRDIKQRLEDLGH
jgi:UDP-3-O-[3-hydroxymyristoyl] glucosamine N-acyltransferase